MYITYNVQLHYILNIDIDRIDIVSKLKMQWLCPWKYSGTEPTYFSYVSEKYGMVATQPIAHWMRSARKCANDRTA